jgi:uncharacterized membrane protein YfcA
MKMPITTGEATFDALQVSWSRVLALMAVAWFGVVTGHWLTQNEFDIWSGNPLMWLYYQSQALKVGWGYLLLALQILALYVWAFTDSFRITSLTTSFTSNALQVYLVYRVIQVDSNWFVCAGLIATIFIGTIAGWRFYRSLLNGRN